MFSGHCFLILIILSSCSSVSAIPQAHPSTSLFPNVTSSSSYIWHAPHRSSSISACIALPQSTSSSLSYSTNNGTHSSLTQVPGTEQITTTLTLMPTTVTSTDTWPVTQSAETELISTTYTATEMIPATVFSTDTWPVTQSAATQLQTPLTIDVGPTSQAAASTLVSVAGPWTQSAATQLIPISSSSTFIPSSTPALGVIINSFAGGSQSDTSSAAATSSILTTGMPKNNAAHTSSATPSSAPQALSSLVTVISGTTDVVFPNPTTIPINSILSLLHGSTTVISGVTQVVIPVAKTAPVNGSLSNFAQASSAAQGCMRARRHLLGFILLSLLLL